MVGLGTTMGAAASLLAACHQSDLPVVEHGRFMGLLAEGDLLRAAMPSLDEVVTAGGRLVQAYEMFLANGTHLADQPIDRLVLREPVQLRSG